MEPTCKDDCAIGHHHHKLRGAESKTFLVQIVALQTGLYPGLGT